MNNPVKRIVSYVLISLVLVFTVIAILGIWDVIELENVIRKIISSLIVIFAASAVVLFIFSVLIKDDISKPESSE
ncbi:MAG: hypothetical protein ACOC10_01640 [Bacteroidota bacterium]